MNAALSDPTRASAGPLPWPSDPFVAVTHPDPWAYYDDLAHQRVHWHVGVRSWIASSCDDVSAVLVHPSCDVRPQSARVPQHVSGTRAGQLFERLVRMTDGSRHVALKSAVEHVLSSLNPRRLERACVAATDWVVASDYPIYEPDTWMHVYPTAVLANLLEVSDEELGTATRAAQCLATAFAPGPVQRQTAEVDAAADALLHLANGDGVIAQLLRATLIRTTDDALATANANIAGWFFQLFDATAGLIGGALAGQLREEKRVNTSINVRALIESTLIERPPIHNTRRFSNTFINIGNADIHAGDTVIVVLAAASRDRSNTQPIAFGHGPHRCPADRIALTIAVHAVTNANAFLPTALPPIVGYRPSINARIPMFGVSE